MCGLPAVRVAASNAGSRLQPVQFVGPRNEHPLAKPIIADGARSQQQGDGDYGQHGGAHRCQQGVATPVG
jgi:hypothetical protein